MKSGLLRMIKLILYIFCNILLLKLIDCIILGNNADIEEFPFMAAIYEDDEFICGGVIIDESTVLTATHCIEGQTYHVRVGNTFHEEGHIFDVDKIFKHTNFNETGHNDYDITILKLSDILEFNSKIKPIPIQIDDMEDEMDTICQIAGWGFTGPEEISENLKKMYVSLIEYETCHEYFEFDVSDFAICAKSLPHPEVGLTYQHPSRGDSGGPLICNNKLVGISSFTGILECSDKPLVYSEPSKMYSFIKKNSVRGRTRKKFKDEL